MRRRVHLLYVGTALLLTPLLRAQHCDMPGMGSMPGIAPAPAQTQKPLPANSKAMQTPKDMQATPRENPHAAAADRSVQASEQQQRTQNRDHVSAESDQLSLHHDTYRVQEFEAPEILTGGNHPAPEVLGGIAEQPALELPQLERWADETNPTLAQARALVERDEQQARQAGLPPDPSVGYSGEHIRGGSYGGGEQGAFVKQDFVLGGKLGLRKDIYRQQALTDRLELEKQTFRVRNDVDHAFYDALVAQGQVEIRRRLMAIADESASTAHELANIGQQDAPEVLDAEVAAEQAKIEFARWQRVFIAKLATLYSVAGHPGTPIRLLAGDYEHVPVLDTGSIVSETVAASPSVRQAQQMVTRAEARLKDARREAVPDLNVQAGMWWSGEQLDGTTKAAGWMGFASAGVQLPLWNRNQGNVGAAKAEISHAEGEVTRTQLTLKQRAENAAQAYQAARFRADRYRDQVLPRAHRAYELYRLKYGQMAAAYPQVLMSERTYLQLRGEYLEALDEEWTQAIALRNYTLEGGLMTPEDSGTANTMINVPTMSP